MGDLDLARLRELRFQHPEAVKEAAARRRHGAVAASTGKLLLVAADHPARGVLSVGTDVMAMGDRDELLYRLVTALGRPGVDGVLATADILEDLLLLGALDGKIVLGSMNRGGLRGAEFELDDRLTGYTASAITEMGFEGGKMLLRIDLDDDNCAALLETCAREVTELARNRRIALVEPIMARRINGRVTSDMSTEAAVASVAIASGLGASSAYTWLKVPVSDRMEIVTRATTLPILLLGGDRGDEPEGPFARWAYALRLSGVRGLVAGRALLYPPDGDVAAAVDAAARLVGSASGRDPT